MSLRPQALVVALPLAALVAATACGELTTEPEVFLVTPALSVEQTGNGAPSGPHYNLNLIGVPQDKSADMSQDGGHVIFVPLGGEPTGNSNGNGKGNSSNKTRIYLFPGDDFLVLDKNGTDGRAEFQLPGDVSTTYQVYARGLGKPGGSSSLMLCATDPGVDGVFDTADDVEICGGTEIFMKKKKFTDVSSTLLWLSASVDPESTLGACLELADDPTVDDPNVDVEIELFNECLQGFLWDYTNNGLKLLQFRFYRM